MTDNPDSLDVNFLIRDKPNIMYQSNRGPSCLVAFQSGGAVTGLTNSLRNSRSTGIHMVNWVSHSFEIIFSEHFSSSTTFMGQNHPKSTMPSELQEDSISAFTLLQTLSFD